MAEPTSAEASFQGENSNPQNAPDDRSGWPTDLASSRERGAAFDAGEGATAESNGVDAGLQALVEYNPATDSIDWPAGPAMDRFLGSAGIETPLNREAFDAFISGVAPAERRAAQNGDLQTYVCRYAFKADGDATHRVEERGGWIGAGDQRRLISVIRSIEQEMRDEERLYWLARNDELTGLLNRVNLRKEIDAWLETQSAGEVRGAYILAGIDDLGAINADFGFEIADEVIISIAERLKAALGEGALIGRVAGTKFGILAPEADDEAVRELCMRLLHGVRESVVETKRGSVAASICLGVSEALEAGETSQSVMTHAEAALDQARRLGQSSWSRFTEKTDQVSLRRRNTHMSDVILTALNERRVRLAFQPIVTDLGIPPSKQECLIRMIGEDGREVPAPEFIPSAERLGLVHLLDRRVLELAMNTLAICPDVHLNVNVSMETVKDPVWAEGYIAHMRAHDALASRITVELTETQVIDAIDASIEFVSEIKELGASFAIDDFGAGYTSFRNLKALDIDVLKIDGSFVTGVSSSRENQLFVRTLLDLARNFGMQTVGEWVDNEADALLLKGLGVDYLQGYLVGKPEIRPSWLPNGAPNVPPLGRR